MYVMIKANIAQYCGRLEIVVGDGNCCGRLDLVIPLAHRAIGFKTELHTLRWYNSHQFFYDLCTHSTRASPSTFTDT